MRLKTHKIELKISKSPNWDSHFNTFFYKNFDMKMTRKKYDELHELMETYYDILPVIKNCYYANGAHMYYYLPYYPTHFIDE